MELIEIMEQAQEPNYFKYYCFALIGIFLMSWIIPVN
jgi:hypothetical protein